MTSLVLRTLPAPLTTALQLRWSFADAVPVVDAWQRWSPDAPDEGHVADLVARAGAGPESADVRELGWRAAKRHLADTGPGDVPATAHAFAKSEFFRTPVPAGVVATLVAEFAAGRRAGEHRSLDFSPWGGAYVRPRDDATAFAHRAERFLLKHETAVAPGAGRGPWLQRSWDLVHPWGAGGAYPNFPDPELPAPDAAYLAGNLARVRAVRAAYDPEGVFAGG